MNKKVRHTREYSSTYAWNVNFSNGNVNRWNEKAKYRGSVRAVSALYLNMVLLEDLIEAYFTCLKGKRNTGSAILYTLDYEEKLVQLCRRINNLQYKPGTSICFTVTRPRAREVFAGQFEDRIVHHWIALRLEPLFERIFSPRTFNCRRGKGQLYGIRMLSEDIRDCSDNYTKDCYIAKLDLQGFFMSINKSMLADNIDRFIAANYKGYDTDDLRRLCKLVILHKPEMDCIQKSPPAMWRHIAPNKSLFTNEEGLGIAIGNLYAQLFANFLLNGLDWFIIRILGFKYTGRYVDDFYLVDADKTKIIDAIPRIREYLASMGLKLHPEKFYLQHYSKGIKFIGSVVKFDRIYSSKQTVYNFKKSVRRINRARTMEELFRAVSSVNSYLGLLKHTRSYAIRREALQCIAPEKYKYLYIKGRFESVAIKKQYKPRTAIISTINNGTQRYTYCANGDGRD